MSVEKDGKPVSEDRLRMLEDVSGRQFCAAVEAHLSELACEFTAFQHVQPILATVSLAEFLVNVEDDLGYWLSEYQVAPVHTPAYTDVIRKRIKVTGRDLEISATGGLELTPLMIRLKKGHISALKEVVLQSRPSADSLVWHPPLAGWYVPGSAQDMQPQKSRVRSAVGFFLDTRVLRPRDAEGKDVDIFKSATQYDFPDVGVDLDVTTSKTLTSLSDHIGGVMLSGVANVGEDTAEVNVAGGNFSLVVDGKNARIAPEAYRKFITALWCVYYIDQDPGISIDPIGKESEKHLVHYIGRVVNTDLGRVMREADYLMKKWAVGTETPDYPGFQAVDGWMAKYGAVRSGVRRRSIVSSLMIIGNIS